MKNVSERRAGTSLPLLVLALVVGVAFGWLLRDLTTANQQQAEQAGATEPTAAVAALPSLPPTLAATLAPSPPPTEPPLPTAALLATPNQEPAAPLPTGEPAATAVEPTSPALQATQPVSYSGYIARDGETLETIAVRGGSTPDLIARYNLLDGEPAPGRELIIPQLAGQASTLESQPILVQRGSGDRPWIAFTLDAGAGAEPVPSMLQTLRERDVRITFFLTGTWIRENPELTRQIVADGHEIANHTVTHPDLTTIDDDAIRSELSDTEALLQQTAGATTRPFFRPPFGAYDERVLRVAQGAGYLPIYWTLDSLDSVGDPKTPEFLLDRVTAKLPPEDLRGAIILAHCGSPSTAAALPQILDRFAEMGFEVKKVSEVL